MEARNSFGRKISLLNDSEADRPTTSGRLPSLPSLPHPQSRTCSYASTPSSISPSIPPLVRSDSTDSAAMNTPSPTTPTFPFEGYGTSPPQKEGEVGFPPPTHAIYPYPAAQQSPSVYPQIPSQNAQNPYGYPVTVPVTASPPTSFYSMSQSPGSENTLPPTTTKAPQKKNSYPCPMAKQFNCNDHFTTSGHAARHAKKHTGKKDAFCPECNKAFTRKDNMEQHRRTHQNGRKSAESQARKARHQQQKRPKPAALQASVPALDPSLPVSPASSFGFGEGLAPPVQPVQDYPQECISGSSYNQMPYPVPVRARYDQPRYEQPPPAFTNGLDTLAMAASGEDQKRKPED